MPELRSEPAPGLTATDHVRGRPDAPLVIEYADFECPYCAALATGLDELDVRRAFRHFPVATSHPRAWAAACAAEAAGLQGRFWEMHELLFADQGRLEDPHLWERAERLALDLDRFERDRRSARLRDRVRLDFESGVRAGVVTTPAVLTGGRMHSGRIDVQALAHLGARPPLPSGRSD